MTPIDVLRVVWTVTTGIGTLIMLWLLRQAWLDDWAIRQVRRVGTDVLRLQTRGELWDIAILTAAVGSLFLAGILAYFGVGVVAIPLFVLCAGSLVLLGILKMLRRRAMFRAIRLRPRKKEA